MTLLEEVSRIAESGGGTYGIAANNLTTGESIGLHAEEIFSTASVIKVAVMVEFFRRLEDGSLDPDERLDLTDEYRVGGSGLLREFDNGLPLTLRDLCTAMIVVSDNVATNMLASRLGIPSINEGMQALGLPHTRLNRLIGFKPVQPGESEELGLSTPAEMLRLFQGLAVGEVVSPRASREMVGILARQQYRELIPRLLPDKYDAVTGRSDPQIAHKTGASNGVRNDVALLTFADGRQWVIAAFSRGLRDLSWSVDNEGHRTIAAIARAIYDAWV